MTSNKIGGAWKGLAGAAFLLICGAAVAQNVQGIIQWEKRRDHDPADSRLRQLGGGPHPLHGGGRS